MKVKNGFTLIEALAYMAVLALIISAILPFFLWAVHINAKSNAVREVSDNIRRSMETITYEIKEAKGVYSLTSVFSSDSGQLSLETAHFLPAGEEASYIDFYLCGSQICLKEESQSPIAITSNKVKVTKLEFIPLFISSDISSIQVIIGLEYDAPANHPEYKDSEILTSSASLRN
ncbi:MAG: hypothetical protein COX37_00895 [Candidatus Nealsonbacteria bacterium CG23_combo_of_CG06-09_8_20_14_all_39_17]|uniref:Prepilin-type N-terminal cleavage/methylation domain-containing protein n=1 Tax=Candidatus Nealsonbacteria bacterium CG23_combo_of_CG06-09_8_20_14_all_39_17 TaxID=1974722 RepID=A0A2G9YUT6_9BACT|nr:MAG: hypothetical protein COX37_00895 [Candidatus Nealsonbacteria bacterium CG23_combo_of_CG06-09_8_20_14_all_39_17]PIU44038.1 MAG: hypothetical protein COS96_01150 [Candidatus Nealsonbacteria bacterium CG07_land_8_20_14_0_80_39_13]